MKLPTSDEIRAAWDEIQRDGPAADSTLRLATLFVKNDLLKGIVERMSMAAEFISSAAPDAATATKAMVQGAMVAGVNYGLRIHEARIAEIGTHLAHMSPQEFRAWFKRKYGEELKAGGSDGNSST